MTTTVEFNAVHRYSDLIMEVYRHVEQLIRDAEDEGNEAMRHLVLVEILEMYSEPYPYDVAGGLALMRMVDFVAAHSGWYDAHYRAGNRLYSELASRIGECDRYSKKVLAFDAFMEEGGRARWAQR